MGLPSIFQQIFFRDGIENEWGCDRVAPYPISVMRNVSCSEYFTLEGPELICFLVCIFAPFFGLGELVQNVEHSKWMSFGIEDMLINIDL